MRGRDCVVDSAHAGQGLRGGLCPGGAGDCVGYSAHVGHGLCGRGDAVDSAQVGQWSGG